jgi:hypothetical protein
MDSRLRGNDEGEEGVNKFPPPTLSLQISSTSPLGIAVSIKDLTGDKTHARDHQH